MIPQPNGTISVTEAAKLKTEVAVEPEITETVKYLIVFLAVLSVALIIVIGYIAMRMCSRKHLKPPQRLPSSSKLEPQFTVAADDTKDIFAGRRRNKLNNADQLGEVTSAGGAESRAGIQSSEGRLRVPNNDSQHPVMTTDANVPDTARHLHSSNR